MSSLKFKCGFRQKRAGIRERVQHTSILIELTVAFFPSIPAAYSLRLVYYPPFQRLLLVNAGYMSL
jgi:hypothetical protein